MRVAVTGARGRLAPWAAQAFRAEGARVELYSRTPGPGIFAIREFGDRGRPDVVVHCAWSSVPLTAEQEPGLWEREDLPLLDFLMGRAPEARFVFLSTGAVYGNTGPAPADESRPPAPLGAYARSKLEAERRLIAAHRGRVLILRVGNLLGERAEPERPQGIVPRLVEAAQTGRPVEVWGDGSATKDYLHCADFCGALTRLVRGRAEGIYNVGSGGSHSVSELIGVVERVLGRAVPRVYRESFAWDVRECRLDCAKLRRDAGWSPTRTFEEAVRESVESC